MLYIVRECLMAAEADAAPEAAHCRANRGTTGSGHRFRRDGK